MDDKNKLIEKLGELSAKAYMFGRMYHIDEVTELTKDINELIAKVFDYSPWHTGTPTEEGDYLVQYKNSGHDVLHFADLSWFAFNRGGVEWQKIPDSSVVAYQKIEPYKEEKQ